MYCVVCATFYRLKYGRDIFADYNFLVLSEFGLSISPKNNPTD